MSGQNGAEYDKIRLERNGVALTEISGDMRSYLDRLVVNGVFTYKVIGLKGNGESFPTTVLLSTVSPPGAFLRGDANRDDKLDIADPIALLNFLFRGAPSLPCEDAADANDDGALNVTDVVAMIKYFFLGSGFLKAPGTQYPWFDPTLDGLTCKG